MSTKISAEHGNFHQTLEKIKEQASACEGAVQELVGSFLDKVKSAQDVAVDEVRTTAATINKSVHNHPWRYMAGTAVAAFVAGFLVRK